VGGNDDRLEEAVWFQEENVVLKATSRTLLANASGDTDKVAVAAAVDACRMKAGRPPALR
jgi:hypothetical protein